MKVWVLSLALLVASLGGVQAQAEQAMRDSIDVSGEAVVMVKPDSALLGFGIEVWDKSLDAARKSHEDIMKRAMAALRQAGIAESMVGTDTLGIQPEWIRVEDRAGDFKTRKLVGYNLNSRFSVRLKDVAMVEDVMTRMLNAGVNNIEQVSFQHTRILEYRDQARDLALKAAQEKARKMAAAIGRSVGPAWRIQERDTSWSDPGARLRGMSQNVVQTSQEGEAGDGASTNGVALGKIAIRARVDVGFGLR